MSSPVYDEDCSIMAMHDSVLSNCDDNDDGEEILLVPGGTLADASLYKERISRFFSADLPWTTFSIVNGNSDYVTQNMEKDVLAQMKVMLVDFDCAFGNEQDFGVEIEEIMRN